MNKIIKIDVAIIILNWIGIKNTISCIESLKKITFKNYKIIVIDNGSLNKDSLILKNKFRSSISVYRLDKNAGFAAGVNFGIKAALKNNPAYFLLLNNDTEVTKHFLHYLVEIAEANSDFGIIGPQIYDYFNRNKVVFAGGGINWLFAKPYHKMDHKKKVSIENFITGCCMLIKKEVIDKVGLLDERYFSYFEDSSFCLAVRKAGYKCVLDPRAIIYHKENSSAGKNSPFFTYLFSRNRILFVKYNLSKIFWIYYYPFFFAKFLFALIFFTLTNQNKRRLAYILGFIDGVRNKYGWPSNFFKYFPEVV